MKFAISCNRYGAGGGLERYVRDLAAALARAGHGVRVLAPRIDAPLAQSARSSGVEPVLLRAPRWLGPLRFKRLSSAVAAALRRDECLIACNRVRGADLAVCGGTHRGWLAASHRPTRFKDLIELRAEVAHYASARRIVAHSRRMSHELRAFYEVDPDRIEVLYPPVDTARFSPVDAAERARLRRRFGFGEGPVFLFPSTGHARKGLDIALAGIERLQEPAVLAVAGRPARRRSSRMVELGYVDDLESALRAADFVLLAPDYEPFGLVAIESVLCGTPLVFADGAGCLEVIDDAAVLRFDRHEPGSLDAALHAALEGWHRSAAGLASRLTAPRAALRYAPEVDAHAAAIAALARGFTR